MVGRTNINHITITSGSIGGGVSNTVDLPTHLKSLSTVSNNSKITLNFEYSDTTFLSGVEVRYKTGSYPESPTDGQGITVEGSPASVTIENLTNGTVYYFRIFLFNTVDGTNYYQTDMTNARIFTNPSSVEISGITPAIVGENYLVIDQSGTFSLNVPEGLTLTTYLVSGGNKGYTGYLRNDEYYYFLGGEGGYGGYVYSFTMSNISSTDVFTVTIGTASGASTSYSTTTIKNSNSTINKSSNSGSRKRGGRGAEEYHDGFDYSPPDSGLSGIYTPYGYVGSSGGGGGTQCMSGGSGGAGAGDGGGPNHINGYPATNYGCGGGGTYCFDVSDYTYNVGGDGKQGCIIITWDL